MAGPADMGSWALVLLCLRLARGIAQRDGQQKKKDPEAFAGCSKDHQVQITFL